jgi:hypothetical protein
LASRAPTTSTGSASDSVDGLAVVLAEAVEVWPRCTVTPVGGTSQILMVLFSLA